jgi:IS5 family transposase
MFSSTVWVARTQLKHRGYLAMGEQIIDATIVFTPRQRMKKAGKEQVKAGTIPEEWQAKPAKLAQKDLDARWFVKYSNSKNLTHDVNLAITFFGYKNHISTDKRYGFIRANIAYNMKRLIFFWKNRTHWRDNCV